MNESNFIKTGLHYGSISGIATFAFYLLIYFLGFSVFGTATLAGIWIPVVFLVLAIRYQRDHIYGGVISYKQGLFCGLVTTLFSASLFGLLFYLFGTVYDAGLLDAYKHEAEQSLEEGKALLSDAMYEKAISSIDLATMGSLAFSETFNKILGGFIFSLVLAGILRRKPEGVE